MSVNAFLYAQLKWKRKGFFSLWPMIMYVHSINIDYIYIIVFEKYLRNLWQAQRTTKIFNPYKKKAKLLCPFRLDD